MDDWEDTLANDFHDIKESVEDFLQSLSVHEHANRTSSNNEQTVEQQASSDTSPVEPEGGDAPPVHGTKEMHD